MDISVEFVLDWDIFPDSFCKQYEKELLRTEPCDHGVIIEIHAEYTPGCPGRYSGHPDNMYPAEDPEVEICATIISVRRGPDFLDRELDGSFLSVAHQYATDWLDIHEKEVDEALLEKGYSIHRDEMSEILASIELEADRRRDAILEDSCIADGAAADWAAARTSAPDENH